MGAGDSYCRDFSRGFWVSETRFEWWAFRLPYPTLNSKYVSVLHHKNGIRAAQYFLLIACRAWACSFGGKMRALAANSGPVTVPRIVHGATRTCGLLRIRFVLPISLRVIT